MRLGAVGVEVGGGGPGVDGLGVELGGQLEVVVDEGLLGLALQIRRGGHGTPLRLGASAGDDQTMTRARANRIIEVTRRWAGQAKGWG